jgi:hypothetical protein
VTEADLRSRLRAVPIPDEADARRRTLEAVRTSFLEREPQPAPRRHTRPLIALAAAALVAAAAASPPGRAVLGSLRDAVGVERAVPALFSLPAPGRLLVDADEGAWVVRSNGSKRLLPGYTAASWSPHGKFVVATRGPTLTALEPDGAVHWSLARRGATGPRWGGSTTDTRIAYLSGSALRLVAGDGRGDRLLARGVARNVVPAWRPGLPHVLAFVGRSGAITAVDADPVRVLWRRRPTDSRPLRLEWSLDGRRLLALGRDWIAVLDADGRVLGLRRLRARAVAAALAPDGRRVALVQQADGAPSTVVLLDSRRLAGEGKRLFMGSGRIDEVVWSPNGRWLLLSWPAADQWLFVRTLGRRAIRAVADVRGQFGGGAFPHVDGWCCA